MPVVNPLAREVVFKVVYYGPGLGGKTTSLQYIHATARPEHRGKLVSLATPVDRTGQHHRYLGRGHGLL
jgi:hypothetical protein